MVGYMVVWNMHQSPVKFCGTRGNKPFIKQYLTIREIVANHQFPVSSHIASYNGGIVTPASHQHLLAACDGLMAAGV